MFGPVSVKQHETLLAVVPIEGIGIGLVMIAILGWQRALDNVVGLLVYAAVVVLLEEFVQHCVRVRCNRPGCRGFMHLEVIRTLKGDWIRYVCDSSLHVTERLVDNTSNASSPFD